MTERNPRTVSPSARRAPQTDVRLVSLAMGLGRIAIGAGLAVAPGRSLAALGFDRPGPELVAVSRLAGGRDIVLGALVLRALGDADQLRVVSVANAAVDAGDAAAFGAALAGGERSLRTAGLRGIAAAAAATAAGAWSAYRLR